MSHLIDVRVIKITAKGITRRFIESNDGEVRIDGAAGVMTSAQLDAGIEKAKAAGYDVAVELDRR